MISFEREKRMEKFGKIWKKFSKNHV